jgi:putative thioredoxin
MSSTMQHVVDVTDADFEQVVVEGSKERPVVVDLWAAWCGPCRTLGPLLEKVAEERGGAFLLAKLDVDANSVGQALLQAVQSQSIPTVVAFRDGQLASMFIGAYPEPEVNRFVDSILPTEADQVTAEAQAVEETGDVDAAVARYREALTQDPQNREAAVGLARILADRGQVDEARELVAAHLPDPEAERVHAQLEVAEWAGEPLDGSLGSAKRLAASGNWREALEGMLSTLPDDGDEARQAMLTVFAVMGDDDPLVGEFRRKLTNALF